MTDNPHRPHPSHNVPVWTVRACGVAQPTLEGPPSSGDERMPLSFVGADYTSFCHPDKRGGTHSDAMDRMRARSCISSKRL